MRDALLPAGLSSRTQRRGGVRILRRFGGAVRSVIAIGVALTGRRLRSAAPRPDRAAVASAPVPAERTSPGHMPGARRRRVAVPALDPAPARCGRLAHWLGRRQPARRPPLPTRDDTPFTPEGYPGLSPEACALLNTPVGQLDPEALRAVVAAFAMHIADSLPPELGLDAGALFSNFYDRLGADHDEVGPEPIVPPEDAAAPAAPISPLPATEPEPADIARMAPAVVRGATPEAVPQARSAFRQRCALPVAGRSFHRDRRRPGLAMRRRLPGRPQRLPARRPCYAACPGPP